MREAISSFGQGSAYVKLRGQVDPHIASLKAPLSPRRGIRRVEGHAAYNGTDSEEIGFPALNDLRTLPV